MGGGLRRGPACTVLFASPSLGLAPIVTVLRLGELASCRMAIRPPRPPSARPPLDSHSSLSGAGFGQARVSLLPAGSGVWDPERGNLGCVEAPGSSGRGRSAWPLVRQPHSSCVVPTCEQLAQFIGKFGFPGFPCRANCAVNVENTQGAASQRLIIRSGGS